MLCFHSREEEKCLFSFQRERRERESCKCNQNKLMMNQLITTYGVQYLIFHIRINTCFHSFKVWNFQTIHQTFLILFSTNWSKFETFKPKIRHSWYSSGRIDPSLKLSNQRSDILDTLLRGIDPRETWRDHSRTRFLSTFVSIFCFNFLWAKNRLIHYLCNHWIWYTIYAIIGFDTLSMQSLDLIHYLCNH